MKRSVLRQMKTRREEVLNGAGVGEDCAIFSFPAGGCAAVCVQEAAVRRPCGGTENRTRGLDGREVAAGNVWCASAGSTAQDGKAYAGVCGPEPVITMAQLIQKAANNLAAGGVEPVAAMLALVLPEDAEEAEIKALMTQAEEKCHELSIEIAGGQTRVSAAVKGPVATVTCVGSPWDGGIHTVRAAAPGQDVVVSKWIGLQGTALLAKRHRERLLARYPAYLVEEAASFDRWQSIVPEAWAAVKSGVRAMHDVSEGGIFGALWELAEGAGVGLTIDMRKLPLRQETVEVCECCGVNPYQLLSGGCLLMTAEDGPGLAAALGERQIPAAVIGRVTDSNDRILLNDGEIRYMDRPRQDEIWRSG